MRNISFALTTAQFLDGSKDVTRRMGWLFLKPGDTLMAVEKSQGLGGKGGKIKRLGVILVADEAKIKGALNEDRRLDADRDGTAILADRSATE